MKSSQLALLYNWQSTAPAPMPFKVMGAYTQGHDEVYFLAPDPIFLPKMLISDPKNDENFDPWPVFVVGLISDSMKNTAGPSPTQCESRSLAEIPHPGPF